MYSWNAIFSCRRNDTAQPPSLLQPQPQPCGLIPTNPNDRGESWLPSSAETTSSSLPMPFTSQNQQSTQDTDDEWLVVCRCDKAKAVYTLLSCLRNIGILSSGPDSTMTQSNNSRRQQTSTIQPVTVFCYPTGMSFHVMGKSKQIQASVNLQAGLFSEYSIPQQQSTDEKGEDWHSEGECLNLLGSLDRMKLALSYNISKELFQMELTDDAGVLSTASIAGLQLPEEDDDMTSLALAMRSSPIRTRVIFRSECLREVLVELDSVSGARVGTVSLTSTAMDIAVVGDSSECLVSIPCRGEHVVSVEGPTEVPSCDFPLHSLLGSLRGLEIAQETCITINNNGMMAIQHQVIAPSTGDGAPCFVDFIMCRLDETDESVVDTSRGEAAEFRHPEDMDRQSLETRSLPHDDDQSRAATSVSGKFLEPNEQETDDENDAMASATPLFGSVVRKIAQAGMPRQRRRAQSPSDSKRRKSGPSDLMNSSSDDEVEMQELDVSTRRTNYTDTDRASTSSPDLFYGRQR